MTRSIRKQSMTPPLRFAKIKQEFFFVWSFVRLLVMLGLWSSTYDYDDPYVAGLTSFLCFAFCFVLMLLLTCDPGFNRQLLLPFQDDFSFDQNMEYIRQALQQHRLQSDSEQGMASNGLEVRELSGEDFINVVVSPDVIHLVSQKLLKATSSHKNILNK